MTDRPSPTEVGLTPKDIGISTREISQSITLTGKDLPSGWPQIIHDDKYQDKFEGFTPGVGSPIEHFSLKLKQGSKELVYLAVEHTNNPENPQFASLEKNFRDMNPQIVLHEGPESSAQIPDRKTAISYGETAFLHFLVQEYNAELQAGEQSIAIESTDMPDSEWSQAFHDRGYTNEEIAVYDVLRKVHIVAERIRRDDSLSDEQKTAALNEVNTQVNIDFQEYLAKKAFPNLLPQLSRQDGRQWNTETIKEEVKRMTGQDLSADLNQLNIPKFKQMFDEEAEFRDKYIVEEIADKLRQNDRIMAVMGSSHVLRQERALREFFDVS